MSLVMWLIDRVRRHKYKLLGAAAIVGGACYYYRSTIRQAFELYQLVKDLQNQQEEAPKVHISEGLEKTLMAADETSQKQLQAIRTHVSELYGMEMERVKNELKTYGGDREDIFRKLFVLCFARLVTTLWAVHAVWLLARVSVCLIARDGGASLEHRELLSMLRVVGGRDSLSRVDKVVREVVDTVDIGPTTVLNRKGVEEKFSFIAAKVLGQLREIGLGSLLLLETQENKVVDQTLDVIDSPQFVAILGYSLDRALSRSIQRSEPTDQPKPEYPAALLLPGIKTEPDVATGLNSVYFQIFKEVPGMDEFCQSVYEATAREAESNDSDELGALLQKLVHTDLKKKE